MAQAIVSSIAMSVGGVLLWAGNLEIGLFACLFGMWIMLVSIHVETLNRG